LCGFAVVSVFRSVFVLLPQCTLLSFSPDVILS